MKTSKIWPLVLVCTSLAAACDNPPDTEGPPGLGGIDSGTPGPDGSVPVQPAPDASTDTTADGSVPPVGMIGMDAGTPPRTGPAYAVVSSDYTASSVSILDPQGQIIADHYIHSGSTTSGLVTALSGDVGLPTRSGESGVLVLLDRFKTDVVTRVRLSDGAILGQVKTHTPSDETTSSAYSSNPLDYVYIDATTAWVTRNQPNIAPSAPAIDRGDDLFRINPTTMQRSGERIDLWSLNQTATRTDPNTGMTSQVTLHARASRMVRVASTLVVGIARSAYDFSAIGDGVVALVDLTTGTVTPFELAGLKSCTEVTPVVGDVDSVLVGCAGDLNAADPRQTSGIAMLQVSGPSATLEHVYRSAQDPAPKPFALGVVSLGGTLVGASANDYSRMNPDIYATIDLATGSRTPIVSLSPGTGRFGTPVYDAEYGILLLPDSSVDANQAPTAGLRRYQRNTDNTFTELSMVKPAESTSMPVRHVYPL